MTMTQVNLEESFEFMRYLFKDKSLGLKARLEVLFKTIATEPSAATMYAIKAALENSKVDPDQYFSGMLAGLALAAGSTDTQPGSIHDFLESTRTQGPNVVGIADAFRKRQQT